MKGLHTIQSTKVWPTKGLALSVISSSTHTHTHTHPATIPHTHSTALFNQTHTSLDPYNALKPN